MRRAAALTGSLVLAGAMLNSCSAPSSPPQAKTALVAAPSGYTGKNPLGRDIELAGFRIAEGDAGKLKVRFVAINHGGADMGDVTLSVRLTTTVAKPTDPPVAQFVAKIPSFGPEEVKDVSAEAVTKLRRYEFPDWQFLRAEFDMLSP